MSPTMSIPIQEHMEVVCSHGLHVGTVDNIQGQFLKLTKDDTPDGLHHYIDLWKVDRVDDKVHLAEPRSAVMRTWGTEF